MVRTFLLTPRWLALHLAAVVLVAAFAALGWWQLDVYRTNQERHDARESAPAPLTELIDPAVAVEQPLDRPVTVDGNYLAELIVPARVNDGVLGAYAVGTLDTGEGVLTVLRGWVSTADAAPAPPSSQVAVTGYLLPAETPAHGTGRAFDDGEIAYLAPDTVAAATGRDDLYDGFLLVAAEQPAPMTAPERIDVDEYSPIRNVGPWQNLSYWAQWWVFAGAVIMFWISFVRTGIKRSRRTPEPHAQPGPSPQPYAPR